MPRSTPITSLVVFCAAALIAHAQWSANPVTNQPIADLIGDQAVPKLAATLDGGAWIAWFDHAGPNYDVRLQRVDANGYEIFPHNGILISGNAQASSLIDWDLIGDSSDNAVLTFTDIRAGGDLDVYAYRISPTGAFLWGANGVALSNDANSEGNPVVAEMDDGSFVFAWSRSVTGSQGRLVMQKLDPAGSPQFLPAGIEIFGGATDDPAFVGIVPAIGGEYILSWIRDTTPFIAPRHLWSQKFDASGTALWGAAPVVVYNSAGLPIAYKPEMMSDGAGGAFFAWHVSVGSFFQGRVQHLDQNGAALWPVQGVEISLELSRSEFNPSMVPVAGTGDIIVFYNKRNSGQSLWGIGGQRISSTGALLWGTNGIEFVPYDAITEEVPRAVPTSNGAMCFVEQGNFNTTILGFAVDLFGFPIWGNTAQVIASTSSPKDKLRAVAAADGAAIVAWSDARVDTNNVLIQNVEQNGMLGLLPATATPHGDAVNPPNTLVVVSGTPAIGANFTVGIDDPAGTMTAGNSISALAVAALPTPNYPNGIIVPNLGMSAPGAQGELLIDTSTLIVPPIGGPVWIGAGNPAPFAFLIPALPVLVGLTVEMQGVLVDLGTARVGLSNGLTIRFGP